jgi:DNA-binding transcriptional LysR family regulator
MRPTEAGVTLLEEARAVLARYHQAVRTMASYRNEAGGVIRLGIPLELAPDVLPQALAAFGVEAPNTQVIPRHLSTAAQFAALRSDELDVGLVRERPAGSEFDALLIARQDLGVLLDSSLAAGRLDPDGIRLEDLAGLRWAGFPRSSSPAWYDELTGVLRSHGIEVGPAAPEGQELIAAVKFTAVAGGRAFALAPENQLGPLPENVTWAP